MGRLEEAKDRLDRALARLETVAERPPNVAAPVTDPETEAALVAARAQCAALETRSREVSERLDAAIDRLHSILKEDEQNGAS